MPYAVGRLYVDEVKFDSKAKQSVEEMVQNIRDEFGKILTNVDWMDNQSKKEAVAKVSFFSVYFSLKIFDSISPIK